MRGYQVLSLVLVAGCLDRNPLFVEPQGSDGATGGGETTDSPTTAGATTGAVMPPTTDEGGATDSATENATDSATSGETTDSPDSEGSTGMVSGVCGDGALDPGEQCDDSNASDDDACLGNCMEATCGDGKLWFGMEECDDGNVESNDGCEPGMCVPTVRFVFVSSVTVTGDMGGTQAAHDLCTTLALAAGLPMATYLAWISDSKLAPIDFMAKSDYPYVKVNKQPVAMNWDKLTSEALLSPIDLDENGAPVAMLANNPCTMHGVHTNTSASGAAVDPMTNCGDWTMATGYGIMGDSTATDSKWSYDCGYELVCSYEGRLYCFQQ